MKKKASHPQLTVTIRVPLGSPWILLIMLILGVRGPSMLQDHPASNAVASPVINVSQHNSSGGCPMMQNDHELIDKQMALWEVASVALREYEESKGHASPEETVSVRQTHLPDTTAEGHGVHLI